MRKTLLVSFILAIACVLTSQAVVISWASDALPVGTTSARLVYVLSGAPPVYAFGALYNTDDKELGDAATGGAIDVPFLLPQETTDITRGAGAYYVVLFNNAGQYAVSTTSLLYNDTEVIRSDELAPGGVFSPGAFGAFANVPEPSTAMLLCLGAAAAVLRRRKQV